MSRSLALAGLALLLVPALAAAGATGRTTPRTLVVASTADPLLKAPVVAARDCVGRPRTCVNGIAGVELVYRVSGRVPAKTVWATVLTDTNCAPDRFGISHCLNALRLAGGTKLLVRHDHSMGNDPCLAPGERVSVTGLRAYLRR